MTRQGSLAFDAGSPLEDIYAVSNSATAVYDAADNKLGVQVLMTSFEFKRALMQEHFNENMLRAKFTQRLYSKEPIKTEGPLVR